MVQIKPVTYTNQNKHQRGEGRPAGAVVYVTGFFICPKQLNDRLNEILRQLQARVWNLQGSLNRLQGQFNELAERCRPYLEAVRAMPEKIKDFLDGILAPLRKREEEQGRSIMYVKGKSQESRGDAR